jgi:tetratricopeptide (TPR) repeat protein
LLRCGAGARSGAAGYPYSFARSANLAGRHADALAATVDISAAEPELAVLGTQRGIALAALGREAEAEEAWREALVFDGTSRHPFFPLARALRRSGHHAEYLALCEEFAARGVRHAQLLLDWGRALALNGEIEKARWLLFDPARIAILPLDMPDGFNAALADEILTNPFSISRFPYDEANRGSSRVHHLMCGAQPELPRRLIAAIQQAVDTLVTELKPRSDFDPWAQAAPSAAHLHPWGLIQRGGAYEDWHTHPGGWLSGVYYVRIPDGLSDARGCIEFGPPPSIAERAGNAIVSRRYPAGGRHAHPCAVALPPPHHPERAGRIPRQLRVRRGSRR